MNSLLLKSASYISHFSFKPEYLDQHALIGISTFNGYFSIENMEKLFNWANKNFNGFSVFFMDEASVFNLIAIGYDEKRALEKTKKHDKNMEE